MAGILNIERINESDSAEQRASKLNSNFQSLMNAALVLDRTGLLAKKTYKQSASAIEKLSDEVETYSQKVDAIESSISGVDIRLLSQSVTQLRDDVAKVSANLTKQEMDDLWGGDATDAAD